MSKNRPITDHLAQDKAVISVEFFPPKDEAGGEAIIQTALEIKEHVRPDFVSITYGAGGTTQQRTFKYAQILKDDYGFDVMPHLTCVGASRSEIRELVQNYIDAGFCNIMALRGDPPKGESKFKTHPDGFAYASDLVDFLRSEFSGLCLGVAGYPEVHPEARSPEIDLQHLKTKVDAGASFITTQLFYRNENFLRFQKECREKGITIPIIPGLMPVTSAKAIQRFCNDIPAELLNTLTACEDDPEKTQALRVEWTYQQIAELLEAGVRGVHLYIMNRSNTAISIVKRLKENGII